MIRQAKTAACTAAIVLGIASTAFAATATSNLTVTAIVADTCVVSATALAFATLDASGSTNEVTPGAITLTCTSNKTGVTVALGGGANEDSGQRRMSDGLGSFVPYNLHSDSVHANAVAVGEEIFNDDITAATPEIIDVYGQVPAGSYSAGSFTDTVLITVNY